MRRDSIDRLLQENRASLFGRFFRVTRPIDEDDISHAKRLNDPADIIALNAMLEEQAERKSLLPGTERLDLLLARPFRYPPLNHASRFGTMLQPGILYGSRAPATSLSEKAYYQLRFLHDQTIRPPKPIRKSYILFQADYAGEGVQLDHAVWDTHQEQLTSPEDYRFCQMVGDGMRKREMDVAEFRSARMRPFHERYPHLAQTAGQDRGECNVAILTPHAVRSDQPDASYSVMSRETPDGVKFNVTGLEGERLITHYRFDVEPLIVRGKLPKPA